MEVLCGCGDAKPPTVDDIGIGSCGALKTARQVAQPPFTAANMGRISPLDAKEIKDLVEIAAT